ncbi:bifunctional DNA-formamidopyrimidine glycosylase/DNA-(apurinic or apyrimidinic site) lyase [Georgenia sp. TF02-10]|uniref:bifunctional DNA-formamidopyrimidine glycosylase/DNA-(apurinic or apyrimidinic site) lyase n=1 Tax=Georgenia sp. TF02-10 TaxID=2917725 RepID=UPI001FA769EB|nr:bifunctional DNA-formamidopyrimidine glycosylase/DNA-(apurinic or apyrimidinic site) lyase [Georgenia sp. TF02-10]UNX53845.1 bifunctional DNA-formamidopyrimidine glycosylase/DNA-(apurinic or apyrimidinic site) lyase [Georgenia sp. TF02-10]
MPELPEVETVRAGLARHVLGRTVVGVDVHHPRSVRRQPGGAAELAGRLRGATLTAAVRRGKYLWLTLDDGDQALLAHLGMSGQLLVQGSGRPADGAPAESVLADGAPPDGVLPDAAPPGAALPTMVRPLPATHTHLRVRLRLGDGGELWFVDQRTFGHVMVTATVPTPDGGPGGHGSPAPLLPEPVRHIARDLLDPALDRDALVRRLRTRRTEVKRALLDQTLVSGVGNIYADEALWRARLHGTRPTDRLAPPRVRTLLQAAADVMAEALAVGGTSFDALYVDADGAPGYFARSLAAYGQAGKPCPRCGAPIRREEFMNRSSFSCPRCQRRPAAGLRRHGSDHPLR